MTDRRSFSISKIFLLGYFVCRLGGGPVLASAAETGIPKPDPGFKITVSDCNIQTAIDDCVSSCTILVTARTCALSNTLYWAGTGKKINLECESRQDTILTWPLGVSGITPDSYARIAHCDLRGPNIYMPGAELINSGGTTDVVVEDNIIEESAEDGLSTGGNSLRWTIRDNLIQNNRGDGIFLASGTSDSIVADNIVIGNAANGIDCNCSDTAIHGNVSKNNGLPGGSIDRNGILVSGILGGASGNHNSVVGNETSFNGGSGITIRADLGTTANYNVISGNVSHDNGGTSQNGDGIQVDGSDLGSWTGNTIVGNTSYNNQRFGIEVDGQNATSVEATVISSNISIGNGNTGIMLGGPKAADTLVANNIVVNNVQSQIADNGSTRSVVAGNKENMTDSLFVVRGDLVANVVTSQGSSPVSLPTGLSIGTGISADGSGLKHQLVQTGVIPSGSPAVVKLIWATPFADGKYDPQCSVVDAGHGTATLSIHNIESFDASSITVLVVNGDVRSPHSGTLYCLGIHQ
jgi:hypothetical protein